VLTYHNSDLKKPPRPGDHDDRHYCLRRGKLRRSSAAVATSRQGRCSPRSDPAPAMGPGTAAAGKVVT
jgi:hypothetical protein